MKRVFVIVLLSTVLVSIGLLSACGTTMNADGRESGTAEQKTASESISEQNGETPDTDSIEHLSTEMTGTKITAEDVEVSKKRDGVARCYTEYLFENNSCVTAIVYTTYTDTSTAKYYYDYHVRRQESVQLNGCEVIETLSPDSNIMFQNSYYEVAVDLQVMSYKVILE